MTFPFEVSYDELVGSIGDFVDIVFSALQSEFMRLPKGPGFIDYSIFEQGYEALKQATNSFEQMSQDVVLPVVYRTPIVLIVLRAMLGFTPPEWAYVTTERGQVAVNQGAVRSIDRRVRMKPLAPLSPTPLLEERIRALVTTACQLLTEGAPPTEAHLIGRLEKADTNRGLVSVRAAAQLGLPYAMVLYERFLGRPFASHRDSVSELKGDVLESAIEQVLSDAGITFRKTKRAERVHRFDQAPDFIVPDEFSPQVVIEAKVTEDDGTARDKVTRVQHLASLAMIDRGSTEGPHFEVIACIAGRGFAVRREDMKKLLLATRGKVFTLRNLNHRARYVNTRLAVRRRLEGEDGYFGCAGEGRRGLHTSGSPCPGSGDYG